MLDTRLGSRSRIPGSDAASAASCWAFRVVFAVYGVALFALLLLGGWWLARADRSPGRMATALWAPLGALLALWVNQFFVHGFAEARPYTVLPHSLVLVNRSTDFSFPSDHAVMAGAVAAGVLLTHRRLGLLTLALAVLMAATRVYVGAHFPLDVVVGLLVGAAVSTAAYLLARPAGAWLVDRLAHTPARPLVTSARITP